MVWDSTDYLMKDWIRLRCGVSVYFPPNEKPRCIVHFVGGFLVGRFPVLSYLDMLEAIGKSGCIVIATKVSDSRIHTCKLVQTHSLIHTYIHTYVHIYIHALSLSLNIHYFTGSTGADTTHHYPAW